MEKNSSKDRGTVLWRFSQKFQFAADKIIPDSLVFCLILTFIVYVAALIFTDRGPVQLCLDWYNHAWDMLAFSMQMSMMVVVCAACAKSRPVNRAMGALAKALRNPIVAVVVFMIWGYIASFINWAFCTLSCTVLAIELSKRNKGLSFPILLVGGYCTSCLGQCLGPTASVYALLATEGNYMQETLGGILSQDVTVYNPVNLTIWIILALVTILLIVFTRPPKDSIMTLDSDTSSAQAEAEWEKIDRSTPAGVMNSSKIIMWLIGVAGIIAIVHEFATKYLHCEWGVYALNYFLTSAAAVDPDTSDEKTPEQIKKHIQRIINQENKSKPLSDQKICTLLEAYAIHISRRTVNKYRSEMNIPDKIGRKAWA